MFSTLLERMGSASRGGVRAEIPRASPSDSINSIETGGTFSNALIASSTPPTSIGDSVSISSASLSSEKEIAHPIATENPSGRSRRARTSVGTYNVKALAGTSIHAPRKYGKDASISELETRRRTISGDTLGKALASGNFSTPNVNKDNAEAVREGIDGLDLDWSVKPLPRSKSEIGLNALAKNNAAAETEELARRKSTRLAGEKVESLTKKLTVLGKRGRKNFEDGLLKASRELKKLADTKEFAHIDTQPVLHEVWSNGKLVVPEEQQRKKKKVEPPVQLRSPKNLPEQPKPEEKKKTSGRREKVWLTKGLYAGQEQKDADWSVGFSDKEKETMANRAPTKPRSILPLPIWHGKRLLESDRDFKLPFDVFSPLPPGQPKPDDWKNSTKNRFIGDAASEWKHTKHFGDFDSRCVCTPAEGCGDYCQNRIMFYECDDENCGAGRACGNRAFADLQQRRKHGNKYDIGVEVVKTADRGYGVRSNRCFNDDQIIVEYNGEIITEEECDRRMNEVYKNNECYYLMAFDQNMIIDATTGSIARFINHSCTPNCKMVKWIVAGKPRMALFADRDIMTGEELTYDYNFDPFSAKNVQECRCGSANCRGFLGPRPKDVKPPKENAIKEAVKAGVKAGKRKLKELLGGDEDDIKSSSPKKRKIKPATGIKRAASSASMKMATNAKGAAKVLKKSVSGQLLNARHAVTPKRSISVKSKKASILKSYGKGQTKLASKNSSLVLVPGSPESKKPSRPKAAYVRRKSVAKNVVRSVNGAIGAAEQGLSIKVVSAAGEAEDDAEDDVVEQVGASEEVEISEEVKIATYA